MFIIDECIEFLTGSEGFPEDWLSSFNFNTEEEKQESIKLIIGKINESLNVSFEKINNSILAGEYVTNNSYSEKVKELRTVISLIQSDVELEDQDIENTITTHLLKIFAQPLNRSLKGVDRMLHHFKRKFNIANPIKNVVLFEAFSPQDNSLQDGLNADAKVLSNIISKNIRLAEIDEELVVNNKQLTELLIIREDLDYLIKQGQAVADYVKIIYDKSNYLIRKILHRLKQDSQTSYLYAFDFQDKEIRLEDVEPGAFKEFDLISKKHYSISDDDYSHQEIEGIFEKIRVDEELTCRDIHHLVKTFKDKNKNHTQLFNFLDKFNSKYDTSIKNKEISKFDKRAFEIQKNYFYNNEFSSFLDKKNISIEQAEEKLDNIEIIQETTQVKNYFPYLKFCFYLNSKLKEAFDAKKVDYLLVETLISKFEKYLELAYNTFEWCKDRKFMAFQLPKEECIINTENSDAKLFLSSSFVLPINYEKSELELIEFSRSLSKYTTLHEVHENLKNEKEAIENLKESIEKSDRRSIEILGVFSAIVLFTSGSIQIFSIEGITPNDGLKFMLAFSYSLVLFIFLIWLITRENIKSLTIVHKVFFFGLFITTAITLFYLLSGSSEEPQNTNSNTIIESLQSTEKKPKESLPLDSTIQDQKN